MPHVTEEIWSHLPGPGGAADRLALARAASGLPRRAAARSTRVQEAAQIFRRSGVAGRARRPTTSAGSSKRSCAPTVPAGADGDVEAERARLAQGDRAGGGDARQRAFVANAPAEVVEAEREKLARYRRELEPSAAERVAATSPGSPRCRRGRGRASGSSGCASCSRELGDPQEAYRGRPRRRARTASRRRRARSRRCFARRAPTVGTTISPHVRGWAERIRVDGAEADSRPRSSASGRRRSAPARRSSRRSPPPRSPSSPRRSRRGRRRGGSRRPARRDERARARASCC